MPTWPQILPQSPDVSGYSEKPQSQVARSEMDAGPSKSRRRFTAAARAVPVTYSLLTRAQIDAFENFFDNDIAAGALPFDWPQPRTEAMVSVVISGNPPYEITPQGSGVYWRLTMTLEIQP